jgi:Homeodomain-like domain
MELMMTKKSPAVKKYVVRLSKAERQELEAILHKGKSAAKQQLKARILLKADVSKEGDGWSDAKIIQALHTNETMVHRVRHQLVEEGFESVFTRKQRAVPAIEKIFDGAKEARLVQLACSKAPSGRARWTLKLLANKAVALNIIDATSPSTVSRVLKKTSSSRT